MIPGGADTGMADEQSSDALDFNDEPPSYCAIPFRVPRHCLDQLDARSFEKINPLCRQGVLAARRIQSQLVSTRPDQHRVQLCDD